MPITPEMKQLLLQKGITGVSDPDGRKIRIYCETKEDVEKILAEMPDIKISGLSYEVEPVYSGRFMALQDRTSRFRPAPGGVSIGCAAEINAGTLGAVLYDNTGRKVILSNNHVLAASNEAKIGDKVYQPGQYDGGTENDVIGTLYKFIEIKLDGNLVDAALATPLDDSLVSEDILEIGKPTGFGTATEGMHVKKSGRTTGVSDGIVFDTSATVKVGGYPWDNSIFEDQIIITPAIIQQGDSGSVILDDSNRIVGLGFAGSEVFGVANKIQYVVDMLGLTLTPPPKPVPPAPSYPPLAPLPPPSGPTPTPIVTLGPTSRFGNILPIVVGAIGLTFLIYGASKK
jgi:hypothetical protein